MYFMSSWARQPVTDATSSCCFPVSVCFLDAGTYHINEYYALCKSTHNCPSRSLTKTTGST